MRLAVLAWDENVENREYFFILLILSVGFVVIPLALNIIQLHFEISKWRADTILQQTGVTQWIKSNVKVLYLLTALCGSSFSAVCLCNSYLLLLNMFSMGLPMYHKSIFTSKRFISVVLFENIPQLCIQTIALILEINSNVMIQKGSGTLITIFSIVFTLISIFLSGFEYLFSNKTLKLENIMRISFTVESKYFGRMSELKFLTKVVYNLRKINHVIYTLLGINPRNVERLMPIQLKTGAIFTFFVEYDHDDLVHLKSQSQLQSIDYDDDNDKIDIEKSHSNSNSFNVISNKIRKAIDDDLLAKEISRIFSKKIKKSKSQKPPKSKKYQKYQKSQKSQKSKNLNISDSGTGSNYSMIDDESETILLKSGSNWQRPAMSISSKTLIIEKMASPLDRGTMIIEMKEFMNMNSSVNNSRKMFFNTRSPTSVSSYQTQMGYLPPSMNVALKKGTPVDSNTNMTTDANTL